MPIDYAGLSVASLKASLMLLALPTFSEIGCNAPNAFAPHTVCALEASTEAYLLEENENMELLSF